VAWSSQRSALRGPILADVERIAVLRANALGDFIVTLPALAALRATYPDAEIVLLGAPMHAELLGDRPSPIDRVEIMPVTQGIYEVAGQPPRLADIERFLARMQRESFDLAVQLHGGGRWSNPFVQQLGARTTIGMRAVDAEPLDRWVPYGLFEHEVFRFLEVVALVGTEPTSVLPRLTVTENDRLRAKRILGGDDGQPMIVVHPGAIDPRRRWPPECFAQVADALAYAGAGVVITGSRAEQSIANEVVGLMRHPARVLCGVLDLSSLIGVLDRAVLVLANDTGPRHVAEAIGIATVSVYWCGNLVNVGPLERGRHRAHVSWRLNCPVCGANAMAGLYPGRTLGTGCAHQESFVADVAAAEVLPDALDVYRIEHAQHPKRRA
jgi:ADP-heptose:LPS heptosyltransferase